MLLTGVYLEQVQSFIYFEYVVNESGTDDTIMKIKLYKVGR